MKFSLALGAALCAATVLAVPSKTVKKVPHRKFKHMGDSHVMIPASVPGKKDSEADSYSSNWSGAAHNSGSGEVVTSVQATFSVPTPAVPDGASAGAYSGCAWVGIDGTNGGPSLWQAGAIWTVDNSGGDNAYSYGVWYEWIPNGLVVIDNFPVNAGDVIYVNLTSQTPTTGTVVIADQTTGQSATITTSAPSPTDSLLGVSAEWITEDFSTGGGLAPFANYGSVVYTDVAFGSSTGGGDASGAEIIDLVDSNGNTVSQGSIPSGGEVDTNYE